MFSLKVCRMTGSPLKAGPALAHWEVQPLPHHRAEDVKGGQMEVPNDRRQSGLMDCQVLCHFPAFQNLSSSSNSIFLICLLENSSSLCLLSRVWLFVTPWTIACQTPLSRGFFRQEYWNGLPFPTPGDLSNPGIKPGSSALAGGFFITKPTGKPTRKLRFRKTQVMGLVRIKWGLNSKVSNPCPVLFSTTSSCFLKQQTIILYLATFPAIIWSLSQTLISIIHWCSHEGQSSNHISMFPEWKGNCREPLTFAVAIRPPVSWCPYIKTSVLPLFFHGGTVTFLKRSKYFQPTMLSLLFTMQTV